MGDKAYAHYRKLKIDTKTKMLTFSDGLNLEKAWDCINILKIVFKSVLGLGPI
jgi:nicotinate phosphoribosyltransferase